MTSPQISNQKRNKSLFYVTFLDGFRGVAALCVVWAHTQTIFGQRLDFNSFDYVGFYGVIMFFVLSAFLLTFRMLLDWEQYHEKKEKNNNYLESDVESEANFSNVPLLSSTNDHLEKSVDLDTNLSNVPPLSSTINDNITEIPSLGEKPVHFFYHYIRKRVWPKYQTPYYFRIPIIVIGYVEFARFGAFLTNHYFKKPAIGAWICRILANVIIVNVRTELLISSDERNLDFVNTDGSRHIFVTGSICAIWYREIIRLGLLPLSLEEENILDDKSNNCNTPIFIRSSFVQLIISKLPSRHQFARCFFDFGCYILVFLKICTLPHHAEVVFGEPRAYDIIIERKQLGGSLDAIIILCALLSRSGSFVKALSCDFLRFCGKISFSMYLLHPIAMTWVNDYMPFIGIKAAEKESSETEKGNFILDAVMMSFVGTIALAWIYFKCVERPSMNLTNYIAKRWLSVKPDINKH
ncbi:4771_t:CDS:2 [Cetraspora pellucida]|uniref:4771_t:CDS:1 n=1 Tax=Cetraspora pellucida TaxID=1433469 RepID=A0A9N9HE70_9GLOM|nr:4771_t:CDS:2 [Cetraspora pellucida]